MARELEPRRHDNRLDDDHGRGGHGADDAPGDDHGRGGHGADDVSVAAPTLLAAASGSASRDIRGTNGADVLVGTSGADRIRGDNGNDVLKGRGGNDRLEGDDGSDVLRGGGGADELDGGKGSDVLTGGTGADVFRFGNNEGSDRITDFADGIDLIKLSAPGIASFADLDISSNAAGDAVVSFVSLGALSVITLNGVDAASISGADFIFSPG